MSTKEIALLLEENGNTAAEPSSQLRNAYQIVSCGLNSDFDSLLLSEGIVPQLIFIKNQAFCDELLDAVDAVQDSLSPNSIPVILLTESEEEPVDSKLVSLVSTITHNNESQDRFQLKLGCARNQIKQLKQMKERADNAKSMAFSVMAQNSQIGETVQTLEKTFICADYEELGNIIINALAADGLDAAMQFFVETASPFITKSPERQEEESRLIVETRPKGRIVDVDKQSTYNYDHVSLLIKNMPLEDAERYGQIKDLVCILMNATESRVKALETEIRALSQSNKIEITCKILNKMLDEMLKANDNVAEELNEVIETLQQSIHVDLISFNMHESEEEVILGHLDQGFKNTSELLNRKLEREKSHSQIMVK